MTKDLGMLHGAYNKVPAGPFAAASKVVSDNAVLVVNQVLTSLLPNTTNYFQLIASNNQGIVTGNVLSLSRSVRPPSPALHDTEMERFSKRPQECEQID